MRFQSYFNHALHIIDGFDGTMPLARFLKQYFTLNKKHGSTDRKMISHACYSYYRLGHALKDKPPAERLKAALFLCTDDLEKWSVVFEQEWRTEDPARLARVHELFPSFSVEDIFPWKEELSEGIDHHAFCRSFLRQPDLFLRIRPGHEKEVLKKLHQKFPQNPQDPQTSSLTVPPAYTFIPPFTLRLSNGFKVEEFFTPDKEIVVQDYSSQRLAPFLLLPDPLSIHPEPPPPNLPRSGLPSVSPKRSLWDACAASGGKSILAHDLNAGIELTVSDIRESILHNLDQRFRTAGINSYHSFVADLSMPGPLLPRKSSSAPQAPAQPPGPFDLLLADIPCSGSGTWSRTPEELYFFEPRKIGIYRELQEKIVSRLVASLGKKAYLVYSTCSVFKKENEEMAAFIRESFGLQPERMETINGVDERADSMFAARFIS